MGGTRCLRRRKNESPNSSGSQCEAGSCDFAFLSSMLTMYPRLITSTQRAPRVRWFGAQRRECQYGG